MRSLKIQTVTGICFFSKSSSYQWSYTVPLFLFTSVCPIIKVEEGGLSNVEYLI